MSGKLNVAKLDPLWNAHGMYKVVTGLEQGTNPARITFKYMITCVRSQKW